MPQFRRAFNSSRFAGVEAEFNGCNQAFKPIAAWCKKWGASVHSDGSCGWEAVSAPAAGDFIVEQLTELGAAFAKAGTSCDQRCGVHVHVDARDLKWADMSRLLRLYSKLEPALYLLGGQERLNIRYCAPWADAFAALDTEAGQADPKGVILRALYSAESQRNGRAAVDGKKAVQAAWQGASGPAKKAGYRYRGLNPAPWVARYRKENGPNIVKKTGNYAIRKVPARDATVEFRLHEGTLDANELIQWTKLCVRLVEYAASCTSRDIDRLNRSAIRALMRHVAPDCKDWIMAKVKAHRERDLYDRRVGYTPIKGYAIGLSSPSYVSQCDGSIWACCAINDGTPYAFHTRYGAGYTRGGGLDAAYRGNRRWAEFWARYTPNDYRAVRLSTDTWEVSRRAHGRDYGQNLGLFDAGVNGRAYVGRRTFFGTEEWARSWATYQNSYDGTTDWIARPVYGDRATPSVPEPPEDLSWHLVDSSGREQGGFYRRYISPEDSDNGDGGVVYRGSQAWAEMVAMTPFVRRQGYVARRVSEGLTCAA